MSLYPFSGSRLLRRSGALLSAIAAGLLIATQALDIVGTCLATVALLLLAVVEPSAALVGVLVLAPLRTLMATEAPGQFPLDIGQMALLGFLLCYGVSRVAHRSRLVRFQWSPIYGPLLLFIGVTGITGFHAASVSAWFSEWLKWVQMAVLVGLIMSLAHGNCWEWLVFGLVLSGVANALVGLYEFFGGSGALHLVINERYFRAFGTFGQPNPFGGFMGLLLPLTLTTALGYLVILWRQRTRLNPLAAIPALFYVLAAIVLLGGLLASWSRGAWLGFAVSVGVLALALPQRTWQSVGLFAAVTGAIVILWSSGLLPQSIVLRVNSATEEYFSFDDVRGVKITSENYPVVERLAHWQAAFNMASAYPWLGVGLGNYEVVYDNYRLINWHFSLGHAHNYYLNILADAGIIGLIVYGKVWIGIIVLNWRARRHPDTLARFVAAGLLGSWAYLAVHSVFDNLYVNNLFLHLGVMLGLLAVLHYQTWKHHDAEVR